MIKLNIKQNALHSLHHAIELMYKAEATDWIKGRFFDDDEHMVEWREEGRLCFSLAEYTPPPPVYKLKFALLHLIQAAELILKAFIADIDPQAIFVKSKSNKKYKTINIHQALVFIDQHKPNLISQEERKLLYDVKDLRNDMEHHEFSFPKTKIKKLSVDFLALCMFLLQNLLSMNLIELFDYDALRDKTDPVSDFLTMVLDGTSSLGRTSLIKTGMIWADQNLSKMTYFCITCYKETVSADRGVCMGCGNYYSEEELNII